MEVGTIVVKASAGLVSNGGDKQPAACVTACGEIQTTSHIVNACPLTNSSIEAFSHCMRLTSCRDGLSGCEMPYETTSTFLHMG